MPRRFRIVVNGEAYEVEIEEVGATHVPSAPVVKPTVIAAPSAPIAPVTPAVKAPTPAAAPKPAVPRAPVAAGAGAVVCPMPGTILDVRVKVGDVVKYAQPVVILEAMKMENEIVAVADGTVQEIRVAKGASVNAGEVLVVIG